MTRATSRHLRPLALLCACLGVLLPPLWSALDPRLELSRVAQSQTHDPWGHPWEHGRPPSSPTSYSRGPDGLDQRGRHDDIPLLPPDALLLRLHAWLPPLGLLLALLLALAPELAALLQRTLTQPLPPTPTVLAHAALAALLPAYPLAILSRTLLPDAASWIRDLNPHTPLDPLATLTASWWLLTTLALVSLRLAYAPSGLQRAETKEVE